ncbi:hypothetical protein HUK80_13300 [Flavobacterium sp. MAH-1]|uniref:T9SS type A sorting domain-containing protein n=1 Tax=Flavobacterium agri TaxID=2743471 RepID=A0A7Y9C7X7_9FLAO|nr:IPT/TIG domain-containing protein [Flavobacterium agri]NUY81874.1 hypothetical protein [Flavobacterium agri]NYA71898.1 hypothetical protein [Flavobacterium agri]
MKGKLPLLRWVCFALLFAGASAFAQTTVFNDDFTTSTGTTYTAAAGPIGTSPVWNFSRSGADFGARINGGNLTLTNDASGAYNNYGWGLASANNSSFASPYINVLASNSGTISWSFNMRQNRSNPGGFNTTTYGSAFILAGTSGTTNLAGTGYAVILGNSGTTDPVRFVRYNSGLRNYTTLLSSSTSGLTDFGSQYLSIRVTYTPSTNTWQLFVRNDGTAAFQDPLSGTLTSQGTVVNNTYTATALPILGAYWNGGISSSQTALFDNIRVSVTVPVLASLSPSSRVAGTGAFTLTVTGANFVSGTSVVRWNGSNRTTTFVSSTQLTAAITAADVASSGTASITVANGNGISNALTFTIDPAGVPAISVSTTSLSGFTTVTGTASTAQTYTVSGANLTADVGVAAPANFEVSTNGTTYFNSITLTRTGNVLVGQPVTVYVRLKASAPAGIYSGNIDHTTTGGATKQLAVSGVVQAAQPTTQTTGVTFTNVTSSSFTVNWTNGNGANRMVLIRSGSAVNSAPVDGVSYTAQNTFGGGSEIGMGNYVMYLGSGSSATVNSLSPATTYHVAVYEYNGSGGTENYLTTTPATGNRTTLNAPVGWQIYTANTVNTINFDSTVDGVNLDDFEGDGLAPTPSTGALNSNAWAIAGFSDGSVAFGGTSAEDSDFDSGVSTGGATDGGLYAFETPAGTRALGIQSSTDDFVPGTVTLRFQNQTGAAITSLNLAYKVYVYNDQASSSSFNFSYSADNSTYTAVAGLNVTSPTTAEASPDWKAHYRVVTLTGLNIPNNTYYYLRWTGATVSGSGSFDEFALDDITAIANPTSVFAPFAGTANTLVVQGNATLSSDLTVTGNTTINAGKLDINSRTLTLNGTVTNNVIGGLKGNGTGNITVSGAVSPFLSFDQTTVGTTNAFANITVATSGTNIVTTSNPVVINGQLSVSSGQTFSLGTTALTGTLSSINNNGTITTQNTTSLPLPAGKTWGGTGYVHYNAASSGQTIVPGTYANLRSSSTGGAVAGGDLTVNGILNLPSANPSTTTGSLSMGSFVLTMGGSASNTGAGDVTGVVTRNSITSNVLYTFGHENTSIIFPPVGTLPTSMSLKIAIGAAPSWRTGAINRTYDFIQTGGSGTKAIIKARYLDSELNGNNESKLVDWAYIVSSNTTLEQGRSNYSTSDNFVELTNVNVGLYFTGTFNQVLLTLDESEANVLTWNGSVSNSWTTAANWTPNATPSDNTSVIIPNATTTPNDPLLNPAVLLGSLNIETGGILIAPDNSQFTINNGAGAWINNGTYTPGAGTSRVIFTNLDATIAGTTDFNNVTINAGAGLRPITNNIMRISGELLRNGNLLTGAINNTVEYNGTNQTIASPNGSIPAYNNLIINGTGATFPATLGVTANLTLNQPVNATGTTVSMIGTDTQNIGGTSAATFDNLTINKTAGEVNLLTSASVTGTLTLSSGNLVIGTNNLTLGTNAVAGSFSSTSMIVADSTGEVRRTTTATGSYTFPIGDKTGVAEYTPITVNVTAGSFASAYVGVSVTDAKHPNNFSLGTYLTRYWKVNQSGITGASATITANYTTADIVGTEGDIAAAQLRGTFNQTSNPWTKFSAASANTITATAATLTSGQTSAFTGLKASNPIVDITGYGSFCQNDTVTLMAEVTGGDPTYTYSWSNGLGSQATATPPTASVGTVTYTVTVRDRNGILTTDTADVTVVQSSQGGTVTPNQAVCFGTTPGNLTLSGNVGNVVHWQKSTDAGFTSPINIANTTTVLTGAEIGPLTATTYFRALVQNGTCVETNSSTGIIQVKSSTWNGTAWSDGVPDSTTTAVITGNFTATADLTACTLTVSNNAVVNIPSGFDVNLTGALTVSSGSFTLENNANLIQIDDVDNTGNIIVKRNSSAIMRQDYTLWSSPVASQNLLSFSPQTLTNRFYTYNTSTNQYNTIAAPGTTNFSIGQGYLIRVANNHPTTPTIWAGQFQGVPNNGDFNVTLNNLGAGQRFNAIGNPYPSPISMQEFVADNAANITGTLYFWRKTNNAASPSYCSWTSGGGFVDNGEAEVYDPNGILRTGQGFIVEASASGTSVNFNNGQRSGDNANQFFRSASEIERHRIWLNATNATGAFSQTLVGYITDATLGNDAGIDGKFFNDGAIEFYSVVDAEKFVIQGRPLPFTSTDVVPMGFKVTAAGNYSIALDHVDGLFAQGQDIFLRDNLTGTVHDLNSGAYGFASEIGTFETRFEVVYQNALGNHNPEVTGVNVVAYKDNQQLVVNSSNATMKNIRIYDVAGRFLLEKKDIDASEVRLNPSLANQMLLLHVELEDRDTVIKKISF